MTSLTGPVLAEYQDLFSSTTTQGGPNGGLALGAKAYTGDGREYRFALAGATSLVPGKLYQAQAETTGWELISIAAAAIGATKIVTTTSITVTLNQLAGGYIIGATTPGQGYMYRIASNTAATSAVCTITLEDPVQIAFNTGSTVSLVASPFSSIIVTPGSAEGTGTIVGVAVFPVTNAQYGWIQVKGPAAVLAQGTIVVGEDVAASSTTGGAVVADSSVLSEVGYAMQGITTADYGPIFLNIS